MEGESPTLILFLIFNNWSELTLQSEVFSEPTRASELELFDDVFSVLSYALFLQRLLPQKAVTKLALL